MAHMVTPVLLALRRGVTSGASTPFVSFERAGLGFNRHSFCLSQKGMDVHMKRIFAIAVFISLFTVNAFAQTVEPLIKTTWHQSGRDYALFSPDNQSLGCWSIAMAQILFYHGLVPSGQTSYAGRKKGSQTVYANFNNPSVNLRNVSLRLDRSTPDINKIETARYLWYAALVTGKDFGTDNYIGNTDVRRARWSEHYPVATNRIQYPESNMNKIEEYIIAELTQRRPLILYIEGAAGGEHTEAGAHALVIDGIRKDANQTLVHLNFGWGGRADGWYDLWQTIHTFR
jgi:hypothetical protein